MKNQTNDVQEAYIEQRQFSAVTYRLERILIEYLMHQ